MTVFFNARISLNRLRRLSVVILLSFFGVACARAQTVADERMDLSSDEAVIAELQKIKDAENASFVSGDEKLDAKRRAVRFEAKNVCIQRFKESARVIVVGSFRYDYGCQFEGAFVDSRFYERTAAGLHRDALEAFGWKKASHTEREKLAGLWVEKGLLAFFSVLKTKPKGLENFDARPPQISTTEKGAIKVRVWIQMPPRMRREKEVRRLEYEFAADGSLTGSATFKAPGAD